MRSTTADGGERSCRVGVFADDRKIRLRFAAFPHSLARHALIVDDHDIQSAVGAAVGKNPVAFVVPCHRVIGKAGALTGYHWGITRKQAMLGWEAGQVGVH